MVKLISKAQKGLSFKQAFAKARKEGKSTFKWRGATYGTQLKGESQVVNDAAKTDVQPLVYVPQDVYQVGTQVTDEDREKHPEWAARMDKLNYDVNKAPIIELLNTEAIKNGNTPGYYIGQNSKGQTVYVNKQNARPLLNLYNSTKGSTTMSEELADVYGDILSNSATTVMPTVNVMTTAKKTGEGNNIYTGWIPVAKYTDTEGEFAVHPSLKGRVFEDMNTGDFVITSPAHKEILFRTSRPRDVEDLGKATDLRYAYHTRKDALTNAQLRQAFAEIGENVIDEAIKKGWNPETGKIKVSQKELDNAIRSGRNDFARAANTVVNAPNHAISGLVRTVVNDDYDLKDYAEGFLDSPHKSSIGIGDMFEIENPNVRWFTNLVNPMSVGYTAATVEPGEFVPVQSKKSTFYLPSTGKVNGSAFTRNNKPWQGMGRVSYNTSQGNRPLFNGNRTQYGSTLIPQSANGKTPVSFRVSGLEYNPGDIRPRTWMPIMFEDPKVERPVVNIDLQGSTETEGPSRDFYKEWATKGQVPQIKWVAPTEENTNGGNWKWHDYHGSVVGSAPGFRFAKLHPTIGIPSRQTYE